MNCINCNKQIDFENEPVWETEDGQVCDNCLELYTDYGGQLDVPVLISRQRQ